MRILFALFVLTTFTLFSCQKEGDFANRTTNGGSGGGGGTNSGALLVKMVQKTGSDSLVTTYSYTGNKKVTILKMVGVDDQGDAVNREYHYHRNAAGIITDYAMIDAELVAYGIDSVTTIVHYNSSSSRYTSYVIKVDVLGYQLLDSSALVYDGAGKVIREDVYESPTGSASNYYLSGKFNYTYSAAGNLSQLDVHDLDASGAEVFSATARYNYDAKVSPLHLGNEAFVISRPDFFSTNNTTGGQSSDSNGPSDDQTVTIAYTYNSNNMPLTSVMTVMPDNTVTNTSYYYQ